MNLTALSESLLGQPFFLVFLGLVAGVVVAASLVVFRARGRLGATKATASLLTMLFATIAALAPIGLLTDTVSFGIDSGSVIWFGTALVAGGLGVTVPLVLRSSREFLATKSPDATEHEPSSDV